jgi:CHAD domain-containing protein
MARPNQLWIALGALTAAGVAGAVALAGKVKREAERGREPPRPEANGGPVRHPGGRGARAYRLGRSEPTGEGLRRIALGRLEHALNQLREGDRQAEAVHEARKDLKKVRAVLRLLRSRLGDQLYRSENQAFRDTGRLLSGARDAQVRLETLEHLVRSGTVSAERVAAFRRRLEAEHAAHADIGDAEQRAATRIARASERVRDWPVEGDGWNVVEKGLARSYRRGRARMNDALGDPSVERLHEWRKRAKDLWYHLRIVAPVWPAILEPLAEEAHLLSEQLGDDHDLAMLASSAREHVEAFVDPADLDQLIEAIEVRRAELQARAALLGLRLYADDPAAFMHRLGAWWRAWRGTPGAPVATAGVSKPPVAPR